MSGLEDDGQLRTQDFVWLCFTQDHDLQKAYITFEQRFGYPPKTHFAEHWLLWLGPVAPVKIDASTWTLFSNAEMPVSV